MKRKNNGKDVLVDHRGTASNIFPVRIMVVDSDERSLQENVTILQKDPLIYKVTKCDKIDQAITWLETGGSEFDIILIGECLLAANKLKLLQIGNARDLLVLVTSADDGIDTITRSIDDGAYAFLPKPIPESVLKLVWTHVYSKRENKFAQVQKVTNDASREKKPRLEWTDDLKKKFEESLTDLGGVEDAKPAGILKCMETKGIQDIPITTPKIGSYLQKYREKLKKEELTSNEGSTLKTESNELPSHVRRIILEDSSLPSNKIFPAGTFENYAGDDDVLMKTTVDGDHGHSNSLLESNVLTMITGDNNIADGHLNSALDGQLLTMMKESGTIPSHTPAYKDKEGTSSEHIESRYEREENPPMTLPHLNTTNPNQQGFNLPLPVEANASCTIGDQPFIDYRPEDLFDGLDSSNTGGILGDQPFIDYWPENLFDGLDSSNTGGILGDPSLSLTNESGPFGIFENNNGNDIDENYFLAVNEYFLADNVEQMPLDANLPKS